MNSGMHTLVAIVRDTPSSWADHVREDLRRVPQGLLLHLAGPTDEGVREIEVWSSRAALERHEGRLRRPDGAAATRLLDVEHVLRPTKEDR